jgi:NAD(P)-dependent dehydrogenase (short-subunit alcohol dehydrogenase family)
VQPDRWELSGRVAVVTGGGRGIGRATALRLARAGAALVLAARTRVQIEAVAAEIAAAGSEALAVPTDVTREDQVQELARRALERFGGRIDVLVNNAGAGHPRAALADLGSDTWDAVFALNARGPFLCSKAFLPAMLARSRGAIVNVGSAAARGGRAMLGAYASAKHAVIGFTQSLAAEVGAHGIRVNAVLPGTTRTEALMRYLEEVAREQGVGVEQAEAQYAARSPAGRILEAEEIADAILFLASDAARGLQGHCLDVNAGAWRV